MIKKHLEDVFQLLISSKKVPPELKTEVFETLQTEQIIEQLVTTKENALNSK